MTTIFRPPVRNPYGPKLTTVENVIPGEPYPTPAYQTTRNALMRHVRHHGGYPVTVYIKNGQVHEVNVVRPDIAALQDYVFYGGHDNLVDDYAAAILTAAGYIENLLSDSFPGPDVYPAPTHYPGYS